MRNITTYGVIYMITSPANKIYIGQTTDLRERKYKYKSLQCKTQKLLYNSLLEYGFVNHTFKILQSCNSKAELYNRERFWIDFYQANITGLNVAYGHGNGGGWKHTDATKELMRQAKLGKKFSDEHKANLVKNRVKTNHKLIINIRTNEVFKSIDAAAKSIAIKPKTLSSYLTGQNPNRSPMKYYNT